MAVSANSSKKCVVACLIRIKVEECFIEDCCIPLNKQATESSLKKGELSNMFFRKICKNRKAISPIIATLLLIAIAVVASLVVYAWVMGYIGFQTSNTGSAVQVQSVTFAGTATSEKVATVYLQNVGTNTVTIVPAQCLYINGVQDGSATSPTTSLAAGSTAIITSASGPSLVSGQTVTIKVTTQGGTYSQITQQAP